jgi:MoxR-like ATPase
MDSNSEEMKAEFDRFREDFQKLRAEIGKVIVGQDDVVEGTLMALVAGGHVLLEGVPGLGKTLLVRTLAETLHSEFADGNPRRSAEVRIPEGAGLCKRAAGG